MARIELETRISAPRERCFDLSLSVDLHLDSTSRSRERAVAGVTSGLMRLGDTVTWRAWHLSLPHRLTTRISAYDRPHHFRDEVVRGPFRTMVHDHWFDEGEAATVMRDEFDFSTYVPFFDRLILVPHLRRLLLERNEAIRAAAEGETWRRYLS